MTIPANASTEGKLYGSVGAPEIVAALKRNEVTITADQVRDLAMGTLLVRRISHP